MSARYISILMFFSAAAFAGLDSILEPVQIAQVDLQKKSFQESVSSQEKSAEATDKQRAIARTQKPKKSVQGIDSESLTTVLGDLINSHYQVDGSLNLILASKWDTVTVPSANWTVEVLEYPSSGLSSKISIVFQIVSDGESFGPYRINLSCQLWQEAYFAKRRLDRKFVLEPQVFEIKSIDLLRQSHSVVPVGLDLSEYELVQTVSNGRPLCWRDINKRPVVAKGKVVEIIANEGAMNLSMKAQALQNGALNEIISFRNLDSRKNLKAQVIDENTAKVYF